MVTIEEAHCGTRGCLRRRQCHPSHRRYVVPFLPIIALWEFGSDQGYRSRTRQRDPRLRRRPFWIGLCRKE